MIALTNIRLVLAGFVAWRTLPVEQYPNVTPPTVQVTALYPGANALTVRDTEATVDYLTSWQVAHEIAGDGSVLVPAEEANGVALMFVAERP